MKSGIVKAVDQLRREGFSQIAQSVQVGLTSAHEEIKTQNKVDQGCLIRNEYLNVIRDFETNQARLVKEVKKRRLPAVEQEDVLEDITKAKRSFIQKMTLKLNDF